MGSWSLKKCQGHVKWYEVLFCMLAWLKVYEWEVYCISIIITTTTTITITLTITTILIGVGPPCTSMFRTCLDSLMLFFTLKLRLFAEGLGLPLVTWKMTMTAASGDLGWLRYKGNLISREVVSFYYVTWYPKKVGKTIIRIRRRSKSLKTAKSAAGYQASIHPSIPCQSLCKWSTTMTSIGCSNSRNDKIVFKFHWACFTLEPYISKFHIYIYIPPSWCLEGSDLELGVSKIPS